MSDNCTEEEKNIVKNLYIKTLVKMANAIIQKGSKYLIVKSLLAPRRFLISLFLMSKRLPMSSLMLLKLKNYIGFY